jgi:2-oxoglutarate ferredoxin oxidoreductase subunit gamma
MYESVIMSGFGGQGIMLMGQLLCFAAMEERLKVTWMPAYGPEMRGGTANCTVILSSDRIGSPITAHPDSLIALNRPSQDRFEKWLKPGGGLIFNTSLVARKPERDDLRLVPVPANQIAEEVGTLQVANMVTLGAYVGACRSVSLNALFSALRKIIPEHRREWLPLNETALRRGAEFASGTLGNTPQSLLNP